jgi:hypothetical protein
MREEVKMDPQNQGNIEDSHSSSLENEKIHKFLQKETKS